MVQLLDAIKDVDSVITVGTTSGVVTGTLYINAEDLQRQGVWWPADLRLEARADDEVDRELDAFRINAFALVDSIAETGTSDQRQILARILTDAVVRMAAK